MENIVPAIFVYLGEYTTSSGELRHRYSEVDNTAEIKSDNWSFKDKLFRKGSVGACYNVEISNNGKTVHFNKSQQPSYTVPLNDGTFSSVKTDLSKYMEEDRLIKLNRKASRATFIKDNEISSLKSVYKDLHPTQRQIFIAELVRKITH